VDVCGDGVSQGAIPNYTFDNVTADHTITAVFAISNYTLTVSYAGSGRGSVALKPPGPSYAAGTFVTLTAVPITASYFAGWSGAVVTTTNPLVLTKDADKVVTATFNTYRVYLPVTMKP
jgi:hypothetical protein